MAKTKKIKHAGRFHSGIGVRVRKKLIEVESKQRKKQICPYCKAQAKRVDKAVWLCKKCKKKFASGIFYIE